MINGIGKWLASLDKELVKAWGPVVVGTAGIIASLVGTLIVLSVQYRNNKGQNKLSFAQLALSKFKEERDEIFRRLNNFYGPFKELRTQSRLLYNKFVLRLDEEHRKKNKRFRTLRYLLEGGEFNVEQDCLLKQVLAINQDVLKLIESHSGVVDKPELQELLGKLGAHIRIIQLAYDRKLTGPPEAFEDIVFPLAVDGAIESAILRLQDRLKELGDFEAQRPTLVKPKPASNKSIDYYNQHAEEYASRTLFMELSDLYLPFREYVPRGGRILDAGCGAGRDTRYFIEHGYIVISFDGSAELVRKCQEYPHAYCVRLLFSEVTFKEEFDGIWACASVLHIPEPEAKDAMRRLTTALKPGGAMLVSLKHGKGSGPDSSGRFFQYYDEQSAEDIFKDDPRLELAKVWKSSSRPPGEAKAVDWLNLILKRRVYKY
jgi:SAM-dependent methyltransferase